MMFMKTSVGVMWLHKGALRKVASGKRLSWRTLSGSSKSTLDANTGIELQCRRRLFISSQHVTTISSWSILNAVDFFLPRAGPRNSQLFMEHRSSSQYKQKHATSMHSKLTSVYLHLFKACFDITNHQRLGLCSGFFPSRFATTIFCIFYSSSPYVQHVLPISFCFIPLIIVIIIIIIIIMIIIIISRCIGAGIA
jgi:hypothetical protein